MIDPEEVKEYLRHTLWLYYTGVMNPRYSDFENQALKLLQGPPFNVTIIRTIEVSIYEVTKRHNNPSIELQSSSEAVYAQVNRTNEVIPLYEC